MHTKVVLWDSGKLYINNAHYIRPLYATTHVCTWANAAFTLALLPFINFTLTHSVCMVEKVLVIIKFLIPDHYTA